MPHSPEILKARTLFPRGLAQPEGGFRFSLDALLLAAFAARTPWSRDLDLGTGCGVVGLGLLLASSNPGHIRGVDRDAAMVDAANANAGQLGLAARFSAACLDLRERGHDWRDFAPPGSFDLVLANPPYRHERSGRQNPEQPRADARFENQASLQDFAQAARAACGAKDRLCLIHLAQRLHHVCSVLHAAGFALKRLMPVHSRAHEPAKLVLLEARKQGGEGLLLEPPLILYEGQGPATSMTRQALTFCPFLACNAGHNQTPQQPASPDTLS